MTRTRLVTITLAVIAAAALTFRTIGLATYGFSDDEVTKLRAAET